MLGLLMCNRVGVDPGIVLGSSLAGSWVSRAACLGLGVVMDAETPEDERRALTVCASCPVVDRCARHSLVAGERFGVWGGMTPSDRRAVRSRLVGAARPRVA